MQKTLLALGGSRLIIPIIDAAHSLGHRVVTCDYLPDNDAHPFADDYRNASITDREAVLRVAEDVAADGIVSFAADPGVLSAAYTAQRLRLPFQGSYEVVKTLQTKHLFREFLAANGFPSPTAHTFLSADDAAKSSKKLEYPVIVKPADSAGSKGVTRVDAGEDLAQAVDHALTFSLSGVSIVETFLEKRGRQIVAEGFTNQGVFSALIFMDHVFDDGGPNPHAPVGHILPSQAPEPALDTLRRDLQRLADLLGLDTGIYNIEARIGVDGTPYIMEVSPRGGGNRLAEFIRAATGTDLIRATVQAAVGDRIDKASVPRNGHVWLQSVLFSRESGTYNGIHFDPNFPTENVKDLTAWIEPGHEVHAFTHASFAFGSIFLRLDDTHQVEEYLQNPAHRVSVAKQLR